MLGFATSRYPAADIPPILYTPLLSVVNKVLTTFYLDPLFETEIYDFIWFDVVSCCVMALWRVVALWRVEALCRARSCSYDELVVELRRSLGPRIVPWDAARFASVVSSIFARARISEARIDEPHTLESSQDEIKIKGLDLFVFDCQAYFPHAD